MFERHRYIGRAVLAACGMALLASCTPITRSSQSIQNPVPSAAQLQAAAIAPWTPGSNWVMDWTSDFREPNSLRDWTLMSGGDGWGNKELQGYSPKSVALVPGQGLVITASRDGNGQQCWYGPCTYSSGRLQTNGRFQQEYGVFSALIKLPTGRGLWPAFWMDRSDLSQPGTGEMDVIEVNNTKPDLVEAFVHSPGINKGFYLSMDNSLSAGYHVYSVEWTPTKITWLVDGHEFGHIANSAGSAFHQPFFLILDLAVGGNWPGSPTTETQFPAQMDVEWIRVYKQKTATASPSASG